MDQKHLDGQNNWQHWNSKIEKVSEFKIIIFWKTSLQCKFYFDWPFSKSIAGPFYFWLTNDKKKFFFLHCKIIKSIFFRYSAPGSYIFFHPDRIPPLSKKIVETLDKIHKVKNKEMVIRTNFRSSKFIFSLFHTIKMQKRQIIHLGLKEKSQKVKTIKNQFRLG